MVMLGLSLLGIFTIANGDQTCRRVSSCLRMGRCWEGFPLDGLGRCREEEERRGSL